MFWHPKIYKFSLHFRQPLGHCFHAFFTLFNHISTSCRREYKHVVFHFNEMDVRQVRQQSSSRSTNGHQADTYFPVFLLRRPSMHLLYFPSRFFWTLICRKRDWGPCYVINTAGGRCLLTTNLTHLLLPSFIHGDKHLWGDLLRPNQPICHIKNCNPPYILTLTVWVQRFVCATGYHITNPRMLDDFIFCLSYPVILQNLKYTVSFCYSFVLISKLSAIPLKLMHPSPPLSLALSLLPLPLCLSP